jgi:tetratricopeptide (TPR) repeat protein
MYGMRNDVQSVGDRFLQATCARNWETAQQILNNEPKDSFTFSLLGVEVPRECGEIWLTALQGRNPRMEAKFGAARDQLAQKVEAHPEDTDLLSVLGLIDAALGRKQEAIEEANRAVEIMPISRDAVDGPFLVANLAIVYAWTNESDLAFEALSTSVRAPAGVAYGDLKLDPVFDPLRKDPRFEKLLAELAPRD